MAEEVLISNPPMKSKINWTQVGGAAVMMGAYFGLPITPEFMSALLLVIGVSTQAVTWALRTYWTGRKPTVMEVKAIARTENLVAVPVSDVKPTALANVVLP